MDANEVRSLIDGGETFTVEFKRATKGALHDTDIVHAAMCLANGQGGHLLLGVEDDGTVTGAHPRHGHRTDPSRLQALIVNKTSPPVAARVAVVELDDAEVIAIDVPVSDGPVGTTEGVFRRRALRFDGMPECVAYAPHEIVSAAWSAAGRDFARVVAPAATWADLSPVEFDRFRSLLHRAGGDTALAQISDRDIARALGAIEVGDDSTDVVTLGGVLLFGTDSALKTFVPSYEVGFQEETVDRRSVNDIARLPLLRAMEFLTERLDARNVEDEVMWGMLRVPIERLPREAAREAVANALVHRDYAELGVTRVHLTSDALTVTNPGGFPKGVTTDNLMTVTRPRSPMLADAFRRAGLVERTGRGVSRMFEALLRTGRAEPDYSSTTGYSVSVRLPAGKADLDFARFVVAAESRSGSPVTLSQLRTLQVLRAAGPSTPTEIAEDLRLTKDEARSVVNALAADGYVDLRGNGRGRRAHLSSAFHRLSKSQSSTVRVRDPEPIQQQDMVLRFVSEYGSIARKEAAELCKLSDDSASRLLRSMVADGLLEMTGTRRTARYVDATAIR